MLAKVIPTRVHAVLDYAVGILLIAAPWIFQFADESSAAKWISIIVGILVLLQSSITNYEGGFLGHAISMKMHLATDALVGIFLVVSPWLFGFADEGANAWLPFVLIGLFDLGATALTNPNPCDRSLRAREAQRTV
jgi:SPW repeat